MEFIQVSKNIDFKGHNTTSLIMNFIIEELTKIDNNLLDKEKRQKKEYLISLCKEAKSFNIIDAPNLKSVFDFYRNPKIEFENI